MVNFIITKKCETLVKDIMPKVNNQNPTIEGEATAHYLTNKLPKKSKITRLASGIPVGTELTYVNDHTLFHALSCRKEVERS